MCVMSAIHDYGQKLPLPIWDQPFVYPAFEELIKRAQEFDKAADQPHCEDPAKLEFMKALREKHGAELAKVKSEADKLRDEVRALKRQLAVAQADIKVQQEALTEAHAEHEWTKDDYDSLKIAYARIAIDAALKVKVSGAGEWFTAIQIDLPTGPVRFTVDNQYADLLAGLPYGIVEKGEIDRDTQSLRLTQAFNYDFDQAVIEEPVTPEKVLSLFPLEPAEPVIIGDPDSGAIVVPRPNGLGLILTGDGHGLVLPEIADANRRYGLGDVSTMLGERYAHSGPNLTGAAVQVNGVNVTTHALSGKHVG